MHQINLERMSPVIGVAGRRRLPDTCVGTDSHTPHVDALGVIAIGVGGLEAENVMLGRASWMRLPDIVGVELTGKPQPGITATDIVLSLTEFLRKQKVVGAYLEFRGEGAAALTLGDRATISNMAPEYGATAAMFFIDQNTLDYLRLTGRSDAQVRWSRPTRRPPACGPMRWRPRSTSARCTSTCRASCAHGRPVEPACARRHAISPRGHRQAWTETQEAGQMPDGAVIIAAITSCTNTSNPRNVIAAGLLARNARLRACAQALGQVLAGAGLEGGAAVPGRSWLLKDDWKQLGFGIVAFACTTCNGMSGALDPKIQQEIIERDLYATAVLSGNRNFDGRIHPYAKQAFLASPPLVVAYAIAGTIRFDIEKDALGIRRLRLAGAAEGSLAERCRDRCDREGGGQARAVPPRVRADVRARRGRGEKRQAAVRLAPAEHLHPPAAVLGRRAGR
jgi:aconitase A